MQTGTAATAAAAPGDLTHIPDSRDTAMADAGSGWLGLAVDDGLLTGRLVIVEIAPDSPAARAGVRPQDLLLAINGNTLQNSDQLAAALAAIAPGQRVKMAIGRDNRAEDVVAVASRRPAAHARIAQPTDGAAMAPAPPIETAPPLPSAIAPVTRPSFTPPVSPQPSAGPPSDGPQFTAPHIAGAASDWAAPMPAGAGPSSPSGRTALGVRTVPVDSDVQSRFQLSDKRGAFVIGVVHDLPASKAGVPPGSVIVAINDQPVGSPLELTQLVTRGPVGKPVSLHYVLPGGRSREAAVVLQSLDSPLERVLVGGDVGGVEPPQLHPTPSFTRRPALAEAAGGPEPLARLEALLRRINGRLEQIERRLDGPR